MFIMPLAMPKSLFEAATSAAYGVRQKALSMTLGEFQTLGTVGMEIGVCVAFKFDRRDVFKSLAARISNKPAALEENEHHFGISVESYYDVQRSLMNAVTKAWIEMAADRRLQHGRELASLTREELMRLKEETDSAFWRCYQSYHSDDCLQHELAVREEKFREEESAHATLEAARRAQPLMKLLQEERSQAQRWWAALPDADRCHFVSYEYREAPEEERMVRAYRRFLLMKDGSWPLFTPWGDPRPPRKAQSAPER